MAPTKEIGSSTISGTSGVTNMYIAEKVLATYHKENSHELGFRVLKDRSRNIGETTLEEAIKHMAEMLASVRLKGSAEIFQHSLTIRLEEVIRKVLFEDDCIPTEAAIKKYIDRGEE